MQESDDFILLLHEVPYHPDSYLTKLTSKFEGPSILHITKKEELRKYRTPPLFNERYLVLFDGLKVLQENLAYIRYSIMFPVLTVESKSQLDDAIFYIGTTSHKYRVYRNLFTKEDAIRFVHKTAREEVSESFCKTVIRQVGLSPLRIVTALNVCDQMGYTSKTIERYVDKHVYIDRRRVIDALFKVSRSKAAYRSAFLYLQMNRHWYRYVQSDLVEELDMVLKIYKDKLEGVLRRENLFNYLEENHMTRAQVLYATTLFEQVGVSSVLALREFLKSASLLEVAERLS